MPLDLSSVLRPAHWVGVAFGAGLCAIAAVAMYALAATILDPVGTGRVLAGFTGYGAPALTEALSAGQAAVLLALLLVGLAIWAGMFAAARRLCLCLRDVDLRAAGRSALRLGVWLWAVLAWSVLGQIGATAAATWHFAPGERAIAIALGGEQIGIAVAAVMVLVLARACVVGADLWQDHQEIV